MLSKNHIMFLLPTIYRHGDRAPKRTYPTDPNPLGVWTLGLGALTQNGRRQHYHLGRRFREIYKDFFTTKPTEVSFA
nr:lysosomal acid phosphatase-like isoform X2 [Parasteatoda tepidariorum]